MSSHELENLKEMLIQQNMVIANLAELAKVTTGQVSETSKNVAMLNTKMDELYTFFTQSRSTFDVLKMFFKIILLLGSFSAAIAAINFLYHQLFTSGVKS